MLGAEPTKPSKLDAKSKLKRIKSCGEDLRTLATIWSFALLRKASSKSHAERLEQFYSAQAASYDNFRKNFLHGRRPLLASCAARIAAAGGPRPGAVWCDIGGGTGDQHSPSDWAPSNCSQPDLVLEHGQLLLSVGAATGGCARVERDDTAALGLASSVKAVLPGAGADHLSLLPSSAAAPARRRERGHDGRVHAAGFLPAYLYCGPVQVALRGGAEEGPGQGVEKCGGGRGRCLHICAPRGQGAAHHLLLLAVQCAPASPGAQTTVHTIMMITTLLHDHAAELPQRSPSVPQ